MEIEKLSFFFFILIKKGIFTHSKLNSLLSFEALVNLNLPTKSDKKAFDNALEMIVNKIVTAYELVIFASSIISILNGLKSKYHDDCR